MNIKKMLLIFMILDFVFIGLVLTISNTNSRSITATRSTASDNSDANQTDSLTEGQKNKWALVETFQLKVTADTIEFTTDKLQIICDTSSLIELRFSAQNMAIAGVQPAISHIYSCDDIKKDLSRTTLITNVSDFKKLRTEKVITLDGSELRASQIYSDEDFPNDWRLTDIKVSGPNTFTVNEFEIEKTLLKNFDFEIISAR